MARAHASTVINAPIRDVWAHIRDFNGLDDWHPGIKSSVIEDGGPSDRVGCLRRMELQDGGVIREQLLELSDLGFHYSYSILESPMPVVNYRATLRLRRISDGNRTMAEWSASFDVDPPEKQGDVENMISTAIFQGGFDAIKAHFGG
ncbi:MAG: SRPBCC family protein [Pseudomonadota bacterium]